MARAKNTSRAEARKRTRNAQREVRADEAAQIEDEESATEAPAATVGRTNMFQLPHFREDIRALPTIFRTRRLLWLPFVLVVIGFVLALLIYGMPVDLQTWVALYLQFFFVPQGLFVYFIGGFIAPRASYLVGALLGVLSGALYGIAIVATLPVGTQFTLTDAALSVLSYTFTGIILGTFAGGFAAWYRNFLRQMQENGRQRRADQEAKERAKRRAERQEARRVIKQRPSS